MAKKSGIVTYEENSRSIVKTIVYRTLLIIQTYLISYFLTSNVGDSTRITVYVNVGATVIYFVHERVWNHIHWGRRHK
jgi:uncharacterized membrane protein